MLPSQHVINIENFNKDVSSSKIICTFSLSHVLLREFIVPGGDSHLTVSIFEFPSSPHHRLLTTSDVCILGTIF